MPKELSAKIEIDDKEIPFVSIEDLIRKLSDRFRALSASQIKVVEQGVQSLLDSVLLNDLDLPSFKKGGANDCEPLIACLAGLCDDPDFNQIALGMRIRGLIGIKKIAAVGNVDVVNLDTQS